MTTLREEIPNWNLPPSLADLALSLDSDVDTLQPHEIERLLPAIVRHFCSNEHRRLAELLVGLSSVGDDPLPPSIFRRRSRNALSRAGILTWRELGELSPADIWRIPGVGTLTVEDILRSCIETVIFGNLLKGQSINGTQERRSIAFDQAIEALRLIATWGARERGISRLGDLWQLSPAVGMLPSDLEKLWSEFVGLDPAVFGDGKLIGIGLDELVMDLLAGLDHNERIVYERRVLSDRPVTLEEVGQELGFTRERARQVQVRAMDCIQLRLASDRFRPLWWRANELRAVLGRAAFRESSKTSEVLARCLRETALDTEAWVERVLLRLAGPYQYREGWLELIDAPELEVAALTAQVDQNGLMPIATAYEWLSNQGIQPAFYDAWLERSGKFRRFGLTLALWSGSLVDKSVALLALRGTPADAETLVVEVGEGHSVRSAQNGFIGDNRLVRVSRNLWALRSWGLEEYTGIADEIAQRIAAAGGRARLKDLVAEIAQQFGVKESSVRVYAEAPMFISKDEWVLMRGADEPFEIAQDFASCKGVYNSGPQVISVSVLLDREALRGSGRSFPAPVAVAMGVSPGSSRSFAWEGGDLVVTWPKTSAFGPSLGSVRGLALMTEAQEGELLRLDFDLISDRVVCERIPSSLEGIPPSEVLRLLTGINGHADSVERVAQALRVPPADLRRRLIERGDMEVLQRLPSPTVDSALESALSELAEILERQG